MPLMRFGGSLGLGLLNELCLRHGRLSLLIQLDLGLSPLLVRLGLELSL